MPLFLRRQCDRTLRQALGQNDTALLLSFGQNATNSVSAGCPWHDDGVCDEPRRCSVGSDAEDCKYDGDEARERRIKESYFRHLEGYAHPHRWFAPAAGITDITCRRVTVVEKCGAARAMTLGLCHDRLIWSSRSQFRRWALQSNKHRASADTVCNTARAGAAPAPAARGSETAPACSAPRARLAAGGAAVGLARYYRWPTAAILCGSDVVAPWPGKPGYPSNDLICRDAQYANVLEESDWLRRGLGRTAALHHRPSALHQMH